MPAVSRQLARIRGLVRGLIDTLWAARSANELMDAITEIEALKSTLYGLELGVVRELDATSGVKAAGWASTQDFVTSVAGGHKGTGPRNWCGWRPAVDDPLLAPVGEALRDGWLSVAKAQVIERATDALPGKADVRERGVQVLLAEAKALDATELKKLTLRLLSLVDPDGEDRRDEQALDRLERAAHLSRHFTITDDQAGGAWLKGRCSAEDAALIRATLIPLAAPEPTNGPVCDPDKLHCSGVRPRRTATPATTASGCSMPSSMPVDRLQTTHLLARVPRRCPAAHADHEPFAELKNLSGFGDHRDRGTALRQRPSGGSAATPTSSRPSSEATRRFLTSAAPNAWSPPAIWKAS